MGRVTHVWQRVPQWKSEFISVDQRFAWLRDCPVGRPVATGHLGTVSWCCFRGVPRRPTDECDGYPCAVKALAERMVVGFEVVRRGFRSSGCPPFICCLPESQHRCRVRKCARHLARRPERPADALFLPRTTRWPSTAGRRLRGELRR